MDVYVSPGQVYLSSENAYYQYPWKKSVWRCCTNMTLCPLVQLYSTIVYQVIPGFLFDMGLWIRGSKDRLMPVYRRLILFMLVIKFFASTQWDFQSNNIQDVYSRLADNLRRVGLDHIIVFNYLSLAQNDAVRSQILSGRRRATGFPQVQYTLR